MNDTTRSKLANPTIQTPKNLQSDHKSPSPEIPPQQLEAKVRSFRSEAFSGPIPPPEILLGYEQACPGAANRIIRMAENQSGHRQKLETKVVSSNISNEKTGMYYAYILTFLFMVIGAGLLYFDKPTAGYFALFGPSVLHAGNYIYRKYSEKDSSRNKEDEINNAKKRKLSVPRKS